MTRLNYYHFVIDCMQGITVKSQIKFILEMI